MNIRKSYIYQRGRYIYYRSRFILLGPRRITELKYKKIYGKKLDLNNPQTLNEKILWLKLNSHEDFHTIVADKYAAREWLSERFGSEYLVPLLYQTYDWRDIKFENMPDEPFVIKCNSGSASYQIIRDKNLVDWKSLRKKCKIWLKNNYYYQSQEWQYKNIKPCIIVERLLQDSKGHIPNDYKLHFINGNLAFVYCSVDREGENKRNIYDPRWNPLSFSWVSKADSKDNVRGHEIGAPATFSKMVEIGSEIAKLFPYVRVDFYDVEGKLYYGEITLHHGSGFDIFKPASYDEVYGNMLTIVPSI